MRFWWHSWEPGAFISALTDNLNSVCLRLSFTHSFPTYRPYNTPLPPIVMDKAIDLRSKCRHFRILVIGRANSGKTTLLKKVCNSVEDPEIFTPSGKKVRGSYYLQTRRVHYLIPTRSIAARSHHSGGVIRGMNHNPIQVCSRLLFHSVDCTISMTNSCLKAVPNSFSTILVDSNPALWKKLRRWTLLSRNEPKAWTCVHSYTQFGAALTIWFSGRLRELTVGIVFPRTPTGHFWMPTEISLASTAAGQVSGLIFFLHVNLLSFSTPYWSPRDCDLYEVRWARYDDI